MKRLISLAMSIAIAIVIVPAIAFAEARHETIVSNRYYYIQHVESGRFLDIDDGHLYENGTQLQIWDRWETHQNQVYILVYTGNGWKIVSHASGKIIEVRNSSHDDYTEVAQWDDNGQRCGRWNIVYNTDGTISFENCESGLYLNVFNNYTSNGSKLIQYHSDGTTAEKFKLYTIDADDVLNAKWTRNLSNDEINWTYSGLDFSISNWTDWKQNFSYPTPGYEYLTEVQYLDPKTVGEIIKSRAYVKDAKSEIKNVIQGTVTQESISKALSVLGIKNIPFLGEGLDIIQIIWNNEENKSWNDFLDAVSYDSNGRCSGIIIYTNTVVTEKQVLGPKNDATTGMELKTHIEAYEKYSYKQWSGDNFQSVQHDTSGMKGKWEYNFK